MSLNIKEGALFIADAHYSSKRPQFLDLLKEISANSVKTSQIILMGDIFDKLFSQVPQTYKADNTEAIELLNEISKLSEVIYLEGNHDFNLKKIFPYIKVYPLSAQPIEAIYKDKKLLLCHGDIEMPLAYRLYTFFIRNPFVLIFLNLLNKFSNNTIIEKLDYYLNKKNDCNEFTGFRDYIFKRLHGKYECDYFIEGHFHQNRSFEFDEFTYINLGAFACNQRYFTVKSSKELELIEKRYSKRRDHGSS